MKIAALLIIVLSNQGYWSSGSGGIITLRPAAGGLPASDLIWELKFNGLRLDQGKQAVSGQDKETSLHINAPTARARITLHWLYRVIARDDGKELDRGDVPIYVFPADLAGGLSERLGSRKLFVWDDAAGLPRFLEQAKVPFVRLTSSGPPQTTEPDVIVLIGQDMISDSPFAQSSLAALAEAGASVMVFRQPRPDRLLGYPLATRKTPDHLQWLMDHPLLAGFDARDLQSMATEVESLRVVQLPADEPALELGFFPREVAGKEPAPIDAVLLTRSVGKGRMVLCQLPLGDWSADPRSQLFTVNAIDYLLSRPQPTPRPSERPTTKPVCVKPIPTINLLPGDNR